MSMKWTTLLCKERPRLSTSGGDHRAQFERDFDRTIFSTPVKRLQDKAQVFPLEPHDAIRTRLTHSLEVSSVARGLGIAVGQWLLKKKIIKQPMERSIEAIAATCGLIHDLGNPPFGHSGEDAIREWFRTRYKRQDLAATLGQTDPNGQLVQDLLRFEGNAQSLRLVSKLQILADYNGLNLTFGTLSASCKYILPSHQPARGDRHSESKPGYFASENELVARIRDATGTGAARNPMACLVEAADDIVYSVADVEDAVKKGVLTWASVKNLLRPRSDPVVKEALDGMNHILRAGKKRLPTNLPDDVFASAFRTSAIRILVNATVREFQDRYDSIMAGQYSAELVADSQASSLFKRLTSLGKARIYCTPSNLKLELMGRRVIGELMDLFWEGAKELPIKGDPNPKTFAGKAGALLSHNYRRVFRHFVKEAPELPENYHRFQLVTDYVCGMTDTFAKRLHAELTNG